MIAKPRAETNENTSIAPSTLVNNYANTVGILEDLGLKKVGEDDQGTFYHVEASRRKNTLRVFYNTGGIWCFDDTFEGFERSESYPDDDKKTAESIYSTIDLIHEKLDINFMTWARDKGIITNAVHDKFSTKVHTEKKYPSLLDAQAMLNTIIDQPDKVPIFDSWIYPNSITWLFAPGGVGKTFFAVEVFSSIVSGKAFGPFLEPKVTGEVLYLNFEMDWDDMKMRRLDTVSRQYFELPKGFKMLCKEDLTNITSAEEIVNLIKHYLVMFPNISTVGVDNITWIADNLSDVKDATALVKTLDKGIKGFGIGLLLIAHTTKVKINHILTTSDMAGGAPLANIAPYQVGLRESTVEKGILLFKSFQHRASKKKYAFDLPKFHLVTEHEQAPVKLVFSNEFDKELDHIESSNPAKTNNLKRDIKITEVNKLLNMDLELENGEVIKLNQKQVGKILGIGLRTVQRYVTVNNIKPKIL